MRIFLFCVIVTSTIIVNLTVPAGAVTVKDAVYSTRNAGRVVFRHGEHLQQRGLSNNCRACHDTIFDIKRKKTFTMADMERGKSCGACHNGTGAFSIRECVRCHQTIEVLYQVKATGPLVFSHIIHLKRTPDCAGCHPALFAAGTNRHVTMKEMEKGKSCGACHNGTKAFSIRQCESCHETSEITYRVKATGPTVFSHKSHTGSLNCRQCHPGIYSPDRKNRRTTMAEMEKGKSCGACHNGKRSFPLSSCNGCHPVHDVTFTDKTLGDVLFKHSVHLTRYSCTACHTSRYPAARSSKRVTMREMDQGRSCGGCHDGKTAFSVGGDCKVCHRI